MNDPMTDPRFWPFIVSDRPDDDETRDVTGWLAIVDEEAGGIVAYACDYAMAERIIGGILGTAGGTR